MALGTGLFFRLEPKTEGFDMNISQLSSLRRPAVDPKF